MSKAGLDALYGETNVCSGELMSKKFVLLVEFLILKKLRQLAVYFLNVIDEPVFEKVH